MQVRHWRRPTGYPSVEETAAEVREIAPKTRKNEKMCSPSHLPWPKPRTKGEPTSAYAP